MARNTSGNTHATQRHRPDDGTFLNKHGGYWTTPLIKLAFPPHARGRFVGIGFEFQNFSLQRNKFKQFIQAFTVLA
jgi:hypothetical protein